MKFHDSLIVLHEQMLDDELSPVGQNLGELREGPRQEFRFRLVVTGERMRAFDDPVDLIVDMLEKTRAVGAFDRVVGMLLLVIAAPLYGICNRYRSVDPVMAFPLWLHAYGQAPVRCR